MSEEATREGVSEDTGKDKQEPVKSRRDAAYEALVESRAAEKQAGPVVDGNEEGEHIPEKPPVQMIEFLVDGEVVRVPATAKYRAKVDGQEIEQTVDNIIRGHQKGAAADRRLEEATRKTREAEEKAAQLAAKESALTEKEKAFMASMEKAKQKQEDGNLSDDDYKDVAKELLEGLAEEDQGKLVEKVAKVFAKIKGPTPASIDEDALLSKAEERAVRKIEDRETQKRAARIERDRNEANEWFKTEYQDIVADELLMGAAKHKLLSVQAANPGMSFREVAKTVGDSVRQWAGTMKKAPTPPPPVRGASARASVGKDAPPETRSTIFNEMRKSRGQPSL